MYVRRVQNNCEYHYRILKRVSTGCPLNLTKPNIFQASCKDDIMHVGGLIKYHIGSVILIWNKFN